MTKNDFITERTRIISEMFDNPDGHGIYPTTKCFEALDKLYDKLTNKDKVIIQSISDINMETESGRLLLAAIAKITTESQTDKTPDEVVSQLNSMADVMYQD